eukprot:SAG11_NODE_4395_length_1912_cov_8.403857_2_plen_225_part_00
MPSLQSSNTLTHNRNSCLRPESQNRPKSVSLQPAALSAAWCAPQQTKQLPTFPVRLAASQLVESASIHLSGPFRQRTQPPKALRRTAAWHQRDGCSHPNPAPRCGARAHRLSGGLNWPHEAVQLSLVMKPEDDAAAGRRGRRGSATRGRRRVETGIARRAPVQLSLTQRKRSCFGGPQASRQSDCERLSENTRRAVCVPLQIFAERDLCAQSVTQCWWRWRRGF